MDLLSQSEKAALEAEIYNIHDTFSRPIYMWKQRQQVVISESDSHNYIWDSAPQNTTTIDTIVSGQFNARILYGKKQNVDPFKARQSNQAESQSAAELQLGEVRVKLDPTGAAFMNDAKRATFDNETFEIVSSERPHGLFTPKFYTFYLKKIN